MENKINREPFKMDQILAGLFNSEYLSDVTFIVEGKNIYAHSLLLMVRSNVFKEQLELTLGIKKIIPITDVGYDVFYQLIRFIYTDQLDVKDADWFNLKKLANDYNVERLVKHLLNKSCSEINMFDICVKANHQMYLKTLNNHAKRGLFYKFEKILRSDAFLTLHSDVIEEFFKMDQIKEGVIEFVFADALARWMHHHCKQNQIEFSECRRKFNHLVRLIRFPTMSNEELRSIIQKYPDLLTKSEIMNIATHKLYGAKYEEGIWNGTTRMNYVWPYQLNCNFVTKCFIQFTVSSDMMLGGFVFGARFGGGKSTNFEINNTSGKIPSTIDLGIPILRENTYTISWPMDNGTNYWYRKPGTSLIINAPPNSVQMLQSHETMLEILFFKPDGSHFD